MDLTTQELALIRDILIRAVRDCHDVLAASASRRKAEATPNRTVGAAAVPEPKPLDQAKLMYSIRETSEALSLSRSTLYALIARGQLQPVRLGRRTLIRAEDIHAIRAHGLPRG
jgi:excisionase family DNA binding protein